MALKKGVCKNFDNCSLADNNEIQEVDSTEFKCQECGKDLHELDVKTKGAAGGNKKLPLIIAAAVVVLGGGGAGAYFGLNGSSKNEAVTITLDQSEMKMKADENATLTVTTTPEKYAKKVVWTSDNDAVATVESGIVKAHDKGTANITATIQPKKGDAVAASCKVTVSKSGSTGGNTGSNSGSQSASKNLGWANYSGPTQGGVPHGVGGTLKITTSYSIDLKDGRGSTLEVSAGETIENTKFENGRLRAGELHRADGTRKWFNI